MSWFFAGTPKGKFSRLDHFFDRLEDISASVGTLSGSQSITYQKEVMYIVDPQRQRSLIAEMNQLRKNQQSWEVYYHQPSTNRMWKSFFPKSEKGNRELKLLRTEPVPNTPEKRLGNCLIDSSRANAIGLGIELSVEPQMWDELMDIIEANYRRYDRELLPLFLKRLKIEDEDQQLGNTGLSEEKMKRLSVRSKKVRFKRFWFL